MLYDTLFALEKMTNNNKFYAFTNHKSLLLLDIFLQAYLLSKNNEHMGVKIILDSGTFGNFSLINSQTNFKVNFPLPIEQSRLECQPVNCLTGLREREGEDERE